MKRLLLVLTCLLLTAGPTPGDDNSSEQARLVRQLRTELLLLRAELVNSSVKTDDLLRRLAEVEQRLARAEEKLAEAERQYAIASESARRYRDTTEQLSSESTLLSGSLIDLGVEIREAEKEIRKIERKYRLRLRLWQGATAVSWIITIVVVIAAL
jgi:chromosome segregation ATPase